MPADFDSSFSGMSPTDEPDGEQQGVALVVDLGAWDGLALGVHLGDGHALHPVAALDVGDGMAQIEGDVVVVQALDDVARESAGIGQDLGHGEDLGSFQSHAACHDQSDVPGAQDHDALAHHEAFHVDEALGGPCGVDAGRPGAGDVDGPSGAFPAAHGEHHGLRLEGLETVLGTDDVQGAVVMHL